MNYREINAQTIDKWVEGGWEWGKPISHETYMKALNGDWEIFLTPTKPVPKAWFGDVRGLRILGLASGGAQQMPILSAAGAHCTVLDLSDKQIESERMVSAREGYAIDIIQADMTEPLPFADNSFDLIVHPVSNCYVEKVEPIWRECYRVLKKSGSLLAGLDNGINYVFDEDEGSFSHKLPFNPLNDEELMRKSVENDWGIQFSHTIDDQIAAQLRVGFLLKDIYEDTNGYGKLHEYGVPTFWATQSIKY